MVRDYISAVTVLSERKRSEFLTEIVWAKLSEKGRIQTNLGYYVRHGKEIALLAINPAMQGGNFRRAEQSG